ETDFTLIGTTDRDHDGDPGEVRITEEETAYLCAAASTYFAQPILPADVRRSYSAVRPLYNDGASKAQEATRDYVLKTERGGNDAALINIFGGKITTYRKLAESAVKRIESVLGQRAKPWTQGTSLPGGDFDPREFDSLVETLRQDFPFIAVAHAYRLCRLYGTDARPLIAAARCESDLGICFGADLFEVEVRYLMAWEWARTADDIVWRRTKLGLRLSGDQITALDQYLREHVSPTNARAAE
ncbi:MAG: glycerol-3-phosphate dehydrogenase C-terminal domain-containing protein, partial [Alphaproteobacteria bacterium]|nr:glycerol-3-phosphate dehydrogenase C-terminal domain-containing protein [Alphaproteobacteria bacterium]